MTADGPVEETVATMLARDRLLHAILDESKTKATLVSELDCSRSTVDRAITELADLGVVERRGRGYRATTFGKVATHAFDRLRGELENMMLVRDLMAAVPEDAGIDTAVFDGADVEFTRAFGPDLVEATFGGADDVRVASPQVALVYGAVVHPGEPLAAATVEFVLDRETIDHFERHYPDELRTLVDAEGVTVLEVEERLAFSFAVATSGDRRWLVGNFPFGNDTVAVLTNYSPAAVEWAEEAYDRFRAGARPDAVAVVERRERQ